MNNKTEAGAIPTIDEVKTLPTVIAGFANEVLEVNKIAPNIQSGTYIATKSSRLGNLRIIQSKTIVAKISDKNRFEPFRDISDWAKTC